MEGHPASAPLPFGGKVGGTAVKAVANVWRGTWWWVGVELADVEHGGRVVGCEGGVGDEGGPELGEGAFVDGVDKGRRTLDELLVGVGADTVGSVKDVGFCEEFESVAPCARDVAVILGEEPVAVDYGLDEG